MLYQVARVDFFSGASIRIGDCHTLNDALDLIEEFCCYDFCYDFTINGRSLIWWYEQGLV